MSERNLFVEYSSIGYGAVSELLPPTEIPPEGVSRHADAVQTMGETPDSAILAVAPDGMASAYKLAQTPLTTIQIPALPDGIIAELSSKTERDLSAYSLLVYGRPSTHPNHTLQEYA
jgi:hypothetical protein